MLKIMFTLAVLLVCFVSACAEIPVVEQVVVPELRPAKLGEIPIDIPVRTAASDLRVGVAGDTTHVRYLAPETDVEVLVNYYDQALASEGWRMGELQDVTVRADTATTATLVRVNDAGDSVTVDVSHRDGSDAVEVAVVVVRAAQ